MAIETKQIKLDAKDRKILLELDTDATQSLKAIAKKLHTSKEVVSYRIKQMEKEGIISNYIAVLHFAKLGLTYYRLYLKYSHISPEECCVACEYRRLF